MNLNVLNGLLTAVENARKEAECYGSILEQMEYDIGSCIPKIEGSNFTINHDDKLWEKIKGGEEFVNKCVSELPRKKGNKCSTCASKICFCICCKKCRRKKQLKGLNSSLKKFCDQADRSQKKEPTQPPNTQEKAEYTQGSQGVVSLGPAVPAGTKKMEDSAASSSQLSEKNQSKKEGHPVPPETKNDPEVAKDDSKLIETSPTKKRDTRSTRKGEREKHKTPKQSEDEEHEDEVKKDFSKEKLPKKQYDRHEAMKGKPSKQLEVKDYQEDQSKKNRSKEIELPKKQDDRNEAMKRKPSKQLEVKDYQEDHVKEDRSKEIELPKKQDYRHEAMKEKPSKQLEVEDHQVKKYRSKEIELPKKQDYCFEAMKEKPSKQMEVKDYQDDQVKKDRSKEIELPKKQDDRLEAMKERTSKPLEVKYHQDEVKKDNSKEIKLLKKQDDSYEASKEKPSKQLEVKDRQAEVKKDISREMTEHSKSPKMEDAKQQHVLIVPPKKKEINQLAEVENEINQLAEVENKPSKQLEATKDLQEVKKDSSKEIIEQVNPPKNEDLQALPQEKDNQYEEDDQKDKLTYVKALQDLFSVVQDAKNIKEEAYGDVLQKIESSLDTMISNIKMAKDVKQVFGGDHEAGNFRSTIEKVEKSVNNCKAEPETSCFCFKKTPAFREDIKDSCSSLENLKEKISWLLTEQEKEKSGAPAVRAGHLGVAEVVKPTEDEKGTVGKNTPEKIKSTNIIYAEDKTSENAKLTPYILQKQNNNRVSTDNQDQKSSSLPGDSSIRMASTNHAPVQSSWDTKVHQQLEEKTHEQKFKPAPKNIDAGSLNLDAPGHQPELQDRQRKLYHSIPGEKTGSMLSSSAYSDPTMPLKPPVTKDDHRKIDQSTPGEKTGSVMSSTAYSDPTVPPKLPVTRDGHRKFDHSSPGERHNSVSSSTTGLYQHPHPNPPEAKGVSEKLGISYRTEKNDKGLNNTASSRMHVPPYKPSKQIAGSDTSMELENEKFKDGVTQVFSSTPREFADIASAKDHRQYENFQG